MKSDMVQVTLNDFVDGLTSESERSDAPSPIASRIRGEELEMVTLHKYHFAMYYILEMQQLID